MPPACPEKRSAFLAVKHFSHTVLFGLELPEPIFQGFFLVRGRIPYLLFELFHFLQKFVKFSCEQPDRHEITFLV